MWATRLALESRTQFPPIVAFFCHYSQMSEPIEGSNSYWPLLGSARDFQACISYVVVSRVTSLQGLLLEAPLDRQSLYNHTPTKMGFICLGFLRSAFTTDYKSGRDKDASRWPTTPLGSTADRCTVSTTLRWLDVFLYKARGRGSSMHGISIYGI